MADARVEMPCLHPCRRAGAYCKRVAHNGEVFRCAATLAGHLGVTRHVIYQALYKYGHTERVGKPTKGGNNKTPVRFGNYKWDSITALARDLGMNRSHIDKLIRKDPERVMALVMRRYG